MEITLQKETVETWEKGRQRQTETVTESDVIVPDAKPDMGRILKADGRAVVTSCQRQGDRLLISGTADYCVLYVPETPDGNLLESLEIQLSFKDVVTDFPEEEGEVDAQAEISAVRAVLLNSRKLSVKGTVQLALSAYKKTAVSLTTGVMADVPPAIRTMPLSMVRAAAKGKFTLVAGQELSVPGELPPIHSILKTDARILEEDVKVITGKLLVKGTVLLETLYTDPEGVPLLMEHGIPFTEILDLPGAEEGMAYFTDYAVTEIYCEADTDDESGKSFGAEVTADIRAQTWQTVTPEVLVDCYIPGGKTAVQTESLPINSMQLTAEEGLSLRQTLSLSDDLPPIAKVIRLSAVPTVSRISLESGTAEVFGSAETELLYLADGGGVFLLCERIPFSLSLPADVPDSADIACRVHSSHASFSLPDTTAADVRITLEISLHFSKAVPFQNIHAVTEVADGERGPSLVIAFANGKESLWDLGKKYGASVEKISEANGLDPLAVPAEGTRLFIL